MVDDVRLVTLASIADAGAGARKLHGIAGAEPIIPAGHYERRRSACVDTTHLLPRENVFHEYINSLRQSFGPIRQFILHDALVTDQGAVITRGGALVEESCWEFLAHQHLPHGLVREGAGRFRMAAKPSHHVGTPSLLLKRPWWRNYGHWLVDSAALIALLVKHRTAGFEQLVTGAPQDPKLRAIMRETLALVAPDMPVVGHPDTATWAFSELHYVTPIRRPPMCVVPEALEALRVAVLGNGPAAAGDRRLLVSRRNYGRRRLANEADVMAVCARYGFEVVYPEQWGLVEQAGLFRSASAVVGVKGAALANILFSPPDAVVVALSPADFADPFFWDVAGARNLSYCEIFGSLTTTAYGQAQNPFTIDAAPLDEMLRAVIGPAVSAGEVVPTAHTTPPPKIAPESTMTDGKDVIVPELSGASYLSCLAHIHAKIKPSSYLEIGTLNGKTLALSRSRSVAVDPAFRITEEVPGTMPSLFLFQGTSDEFFEAHDPRLLLGGPVDLAFLDGMHLFEFLLRDFINTERCSHRGSMIILHDCVPLDLEMTGRDMAQVQARPNARHPGWWTGDVWKTVDMLMRYRPDLDIVALDAPPTGLVVIRNLDPSSSVLKDNYDRIVDELSIRPDLPAFSDYIRKLPLYGTSVIDWFDPIEAIANPPTLT